jgi:hypothetical protein
MIGGSIYRFDSLSGRDLPVLAATEAANFYHTRDFVRFA